MQGSNFLAFLLIVIGAGLMITGIRGTTKNVVRVLAK
jgi:hypothetical protein